MNKKQRSRPQGGDNGGIMQWIQHEQQEPQLQPQLLQPELNMIEFEADMQYTVDPTMAFGDGNTSTEDISGGLMLGTSSGLLDSVIANDDMGQNHYSYFSRTSRWLSNHLLSLNDPGRNFPPNGAIGLDGHTFSYNNFASSGHSHASSFQPYKRAIPKSTMSRGLDEISTKWGN
ncbi:hypothetical protein PENARI_c118G05593 [Penicillium arizonense]|uniref:Uncharacterized protein n=1 Tax=Penicillium arizonense TaxID=1835702 RepID=A0A1F5L0I6_PENAI|nr:hypothetical protein PENARI_c118G05593 [Penicillium arizonense]OGE46758.1 hypothetical protein PENARI_c118G05593 [Penicillium arizonense]